MKNEKLTKKDLRKFGFLVGTLFMLLFGMILPYLKNRGFVAWPYVVGTIFVLPALFSPLVLRPVHFVWMQIGHVLGYINTRIIAVIMFVLIFTPIGLFMRFISRDILSRSLKDDIDSYRNDIVDYDITHMERPF